MSLLNDQQIQHAIETMKEYMSVPANSQGKTAVMLEEELDKRRIEVIEKELRPLLHAYLSGEIELPDFKSKIDSINKRNEFWGFKGIKGQMFFNMVFNIADDINECSDEIKTAITVPTNEQMASSRIKNFSSYVKRLGDQWVEAGNTRHKAPKISSIPFFLSYFWQIQDIGTWPVFYTSSINVMEDLNLWQSSGDLAQDYINFKHIHEDLAEVFTKHSDDVFNLYKVEHVFWFKTGNVGSLLERNNKSQHEENVSPSISTSFAQDRLARLPESYVPPIVSILPKMAINEDILIEAAKNSGISLERAFEKNIDVAFKLLGYETKLMGQGKGRVPDGSAAAHDDSYTILWDAKIRSDGYSMGTDDRTIREYITTQSRDIKKRRSLRNIYYIIVSSHFADDYDEAIRSIKMDTDVNEVILLEASALVSMVDAKLRDPTITLGPDGFQRLFSSSGVITAEKVRKYLL